MHSLNEYLYVIGMGKGLKDTDQHLCLGNILNGIFIENNTERA